MITTCEKCGGLKADPGEMYAGRGCNCQTTESAVINRANEIRKMSASEMRLQFGEMSAAEIRLVRAIIKCVLAAMPNEKS